MDEIPSESGHFERAARFQRLHHRIEPLLLPNPWDVGSARLLAGLGFEALGTTSLGVAIGHGRMRATKAEILQNCGAISSATSLPVTADLEDCFSREPGDAAQAMESAYLAGAVGASIEDAPSNSDGGVFELELAVERVRAAVEVARRLPIPFTVTARAENFLRGTPDLGNTIKRLQAFEAAGASVLYAPGLRTLDEIRAVASEVSRPVNVVMGLADPSITVSQLRETGVRRVSIGGALCRLALRSFIDGAKEMKEGRFRFVKGMTSLEEFRHAFS